MVSAKGLAEHHEFPSLKAFGRTEATRETAGATTSETRYFALSWMPAPGVLMATVRAHWTIENALHWQLEVSFREDAARNRKDNSPGNIAVLRRRALDVMRRDTSNGSRRRTTSPPLPPRSARPSTRSAPVPPRRDPPASVRRFIPIGGFTALTCPGLNSGGQPLRWRKPEQVHTMKRLVIDVDGTLTTGEGGAYADAEVRHDVVRMLRSYREKGFEIVLHTSRNMRTHQSSVGEINAHTLPILFEWLHRHDIPYNEIWTGKPWCGHEGFYVDDKAVRPDEFAAPSYNEICALVGIPADPPTR